MKSSCLIKYRGSIYKAGAKTWSNKGWECTDKNPGMDGMPTFSFSKKRTTYCIVFDEDEKKVSMEVFTNSGESVQGPHESLSVGSWVKSPSVGAAITKLCKRYLLPQVSESCLNKLWSLMKWPI
jgi:hypothetical protein